RKAEAERARQGQSTIAPLPIHVFRKRGEGNWSRPLRRPVLSIQTVYFHDSDREDAQRLGSGLYGRLTRPMDDPLARGPGIPVLVGVRAEYVDLTAAETVILIPLLGTQTRGLMGEAVLRTLGEWHAALGPGHVVPVPASPNWRSDESRLPGK